MLLMGKIRVLVYNMHLASGKHRQCLYCKYWTATLKVVDASYSEITIFDLDPIIKFLKKKV